MARVCRLLASSGPGFSVHGVQGGLPPTETWTHQAMPCHVVSCAILGRPEGVEAHRHPSGVTYM